MSAIPVCPHYKATACKTHSHGGALLRRLPRMLAIVTLALHAAGCGMSFPIGALSQDEGTTGSIVARPASPLSPELNDEDWRRAKSALSLALDPVGNGSSARWDNPASGMQGSFTPVGQPFVKADEICRAFLADFSQNDLDRSLQGMACRFSGQDWAIRDVKQKKQG